MISLIADNVSGRNLVLNSIVSSVSKPIDREECAMVERMRLGDEAGYRWILGRYRTRAVRLATHVLKRSADAEDVAQDAFVRAFRSIRSLRDNTRFASWFFAIVIRVCQDRLRVAPGKHELLASGSGTVHEAVGSDISEQAHLRLTINTLLQQLTPPYRAALVLRELEGLEYEEIAEILHIPVGTVRSRLNVARTQFRALWTTLDQEQKNV